MEWLSADEFVSVAFCAGFDSTDVAWMDTFEAICCDHGCDPAVGVSKEAFLELVNEAFERRRPASPSQSPRVVSALPHQLANEGLTFGSESLARQHSWPDFQFASEDEYLADFREIALELGPGTVAQLGLDESGYLWARQVFHLLTVHLLERGRSQAERPIPRLDLCRPMPRSGASSSMLIGFPQQWPWRTWSSIEGCTLLNELVGSERSVASKDTRPEGEVEDILPLGDEDDADADEGWNLSLYATHWDD